MLRTKYYPDEYYESLKPEVSLESYFGKTKNLIEAEKCCEKIVKMINNCSANQLPKLELNSTKEVTKLTNLLENEFKFKQLDLMFSYTIIFGLDVINETIPYNAMTFPCGGWIAAMNGMPILPNIKGNKYDGGNKMYCFVTVTTQLVRICKFTGSELLAIILHEIGHNFDTSILTALVKIWQLAFYGGLMSIPDYVITTIALGINNYIGKVYATISDIVSKTSPGLVKFITIFQDFMYELNVSLFGVINIPTVVTQRLFNLSTNPFNALYLFRDTGSEVFADSFATAYGYGPALSSALTKFDNMHERGVVTKGLKKNPMNLLFDFNRCMFILSVSLFDCHPSDGARIKNQIRKLKSELNNKEIPNKMRSLIKQDLELCEKINDKYTSIESYEDKYAYTTFVYRYLNDRLGNVIDFKSLIMRALPYSEA